MQRANPFQTSDVMNNFLPDPKVTNFRLDEKKQTAHIQDEETTLTSCFFMLLV